MGGDVKNMNGGNEPFSFEAWREFGTQVIQLDDHLAVKVRRYDVLSLLNSENAAKLNPLLDAIQLAMKGDNEAVSKKLVQSPESLGALSEILNDLLIKTMVEPALVEQGNDSDNAISVNHIPTEFKFKIFLEMVGGMERLATLSNFRQPAASGVVARPKK